MNRTRQVLAVHNEVGGHGIEGGSQLLLTPGLSEARPPDLQLVDHLDASLHAGPQLPCHAVTEGSKAGGQQGLHGDLQAVGTGSARGLRVGGLRRPSGWNGQGVF